MINNRKMLDMKLIERGYTLNKLASAIDMSTTTLNNKLNHELDFRLAEAVRIADVLDLNQEEFMAMFIGKTFI